MNEGANSSKAGMGKQGDMEHARGTTTLAVHLGALGDLVLALPALAELARAGPVEAWGPSRERLSLGLAPRGPIARTRVLPHELFGEEPGSLTFERVVVFAKREGPLARNLPGAFFVDAGTNGHVSDVLLDGLIAQGLARPDALRHPVLQGPASERTLLVVQPGAGGRAKRWPAE